MAAIDHCDCPPERRRRDADGRCFSCGGTLPPQGWWGLTEDGRADLAFESSVVPRPAPSSFEDWLSSRPIDEVTIDLTYPGGYLTVSPWGVFVRRSPPGLLKRILGRAWR
ncbi:hypothetical protein [Inquilinus sp.]|jgi:hypothetical protein|uniref:hypothetical protein n=1 Tax=Inquilinus sp. TaxID=1932117 RepID=UPI003782E467